MLVLEREAAREMKKNGSRKRANSVDESSSSSSRYSSESDSDYYGRSRKRANSVLSPQTRAKMKNYLSVTSQDMDQSTMSKVISAQKAALVTLMDRVLSTKYVLEQSIPSIKIMCGKDLIHTVEESKVCELKDSVFSRILTSDTKEASKRVFDINTANGLFSGTSAKLLFTMMELDSFVFDLAAVSNLRELMVCPLLAHFLGLPVRYISAALNSMPEPSDIAGKIDSKFLVSLVIETTSILEVGEEAYNALFQDFQKLLNDSLADHVYKLYKECTGDDQLQFSALGALRLGSITDLLMAVKVVDAKTRSARRNSHYEPVMSPDAFTICQLRLLLESFLSQRSTWTTADEEVLNNKTFWGVMQVDEEDRSHSHSNSVDFDIYRSFMVWLRRDKVLASFPFLVSHVMSILKNIKTESFTTSQSLELMMVGIL